MIKRIKIVCLLLTLLLCFSFPLTAGATSDIDIIVGDEVDTSSEDEIRVFIDGERLSLDVAPTIEDGYTLVPVSAILNALGASVTWNSETRTVTAKRGETVVALVIDEKEATVNGNTVTLDVPARIDSGRTFVPLRFVSQAFDAEPVWDGSARTINIRRPVRVTSLTLAPAELSLRSGQTGQVTVTAVMADGTQEKVEGDAVSWRAANTAVATVENGVVTGAGPGNTVITVSYEGASAGITVKVDESLSGISISPVNLSLEMGDKSTLALVSRYTDQEQQSLPVGRASWRTSNSRVATVSEGEITAVAPGTVTITATFLNHQATAIVEVFRDMPVAFPDVELLAVIRSELEKPSGSIYRSELATITELKAGDRLIEDLSGIEYCTNLRSLSLERTHISNIEQLNELKALERLSLGYNQITDITPLTDLENLRQLSLNNNRVSNITALSELTSLRWLSLAGNEISVITALEDMHNLETLNISANNISSIRPLEYLTGLVTLHFWDNEISDLSPLRGLTKLATINAWGNNISSVSPLTHLNNLSWVTLGNNPLDFSVTEVRRLRERGVYVGMERF